MHAVYLIGQLPNRSVCPVNDEENMAIDRECEKLTDIQDRVHIGERLVHISI